MPRTSLWLLPLLLCPACAARPSGPFADPLTTVYAPGLGVDLESTRATPGGILVQEVRQGSGRTAEADSRVQVGYTVSLPDGTHVESTPESAPLTVDLSEGTTIFGEGIVGMRVGGVRILIVPPDQAYGADGVPGLVPPHSTLVFSVELVDVLAGS